MFTVLHSGAGAGKTHALVKHYLAHCLAAAEPGAYRQVLALTFTNKAAGEMRERVMRYLEALAAADTNNAQLADVMDTLVRRTGTDPATIAQRAAATLTHMLHHWGDVAIGTIDAFTRRVVRPFARDLQLDHELRMTTEEAYYRDRAVEGLIAEAGVSPTVTGLLTEACLQLLHEERGWDPEKPLQELGGQLSRENAIGPMQELGALDALQVQELARTLRTQEHAFRQQVNALGHEALRMIEDAGLTVQDMAHGAGGIHGSFRKLAAFTEDWDPPGRNAQKTLETGKWHSGKADREAIAALERISGPLTELFHQALELRESGYRAFVIRRAVGRELLTAYTLHALDQHLEAIKRADGVTFFSDLTRKVAQVVRHEPVPFIHERMGERYRHFLIDEFQDTSLLQWNALLPLIDNALGSGGSALLVGDAKQAIYRWRNGEVRLFQGLPRIFRRDPTDAAEAQREGTLVRTYGETPPLNRNYRSTATIIRFNNALFGTLCDTLPEHLRGIYDSHAQQVEREVEGLVRLERLPSDVKGAEREIAMLDHVQRQLDAALQDGFAPGDVAVLVRSGNLGRTVARHLVANGHAVVSPDGLRLSGDPVIELLLDLLRFLYTGDPASAARVLQGQARIFAAHGVETVEPFAGEEGLVDPAERLHRWLDAHGKPRLRTTLTDLIARLARAHGIQPAADAQVLTLLDEAHAFTTQHGQDIGGFIAYYERSGEKRSLDPPAHGRAVQVMTVHKSKGLEFPVVLVPDAQMAGRGNHAERLWIRPGDAVPGLPVALVREDKKLREQEVPELLEEDAMRQLDALNLLYVAFTRAGQRLHALVHEGSHDTVSKALLAYLGSHGTEGLLELGQRLPPWKVQDHPHTDDLVDVNSNDGMPALAIRFEAPESWDPTDPDPYRRFGNAVHGLLAQVATAADVYEAVHDAVSRGELEEGSAGVLAEKLHALLGSPALAPWYGAGLRVRSEATLITAEGRSLRPDRVVQDGEALRVLDFKTGRPSPMHHEQVRSYMHHLGELGHPHVEGALLYLPEGELMFVAP